MYSLFKRSAHLRKGSQSTDMKREVILNSYEDLEQKPSLLEGVHEDMSNKLYSFYNGMVYLKQVEYPSRKHAVAPDGEIPNSVIRRRKIVEEVIEEKPKDKLFSGVWKIDRPIDVDAMQLGESLIDVIDPNMMTESLDEIKAMAEELAMANQDKLDADKIEMFPNLALPGWQNTKLCRITGKLFKELAFKLTPDADWNAVFDRLIAMLDTKEFPVFSTACKYLVEFNNCHVIPEDYRKAVGAQLYLKLKPKVDPNIKITALKSIGAMNIRQEKDFGLIRENIDSDDIDVSTAAIELEKLFKIPRDVPMEATKPKEEVELKHKLPRKTGEAGRLPRMGKGVEPRMPRTMKGKTKFAEGGPKTKPDHEPKTDDEPKPDESSPEAKPDERGLEPKPFELEPIPGFDKSLWKVTTLDEDKETTIGVQKPEEEEEEVQLAMEKEHERKGKFAEKRKREGIETTETEEEEKKGKIDLLSMDEETALEDSHRLMEDDIESLHKKAKSEELAEGETRLAELEAKDLETEMALDLKEEGEEEGGGEEEEAVSLTSKKETGRKAMTPEQLLAAKKGLVLKEEKKNFVVKGKKPAFMVKDEKRVLEMDDDDQFLALKDEEQLLAAKERFEEITSEEPETSAYMEEVQEAARDEEWKQALVSKVLTERAEKKNIHFDRNISFRHPTDMLQKEQVFSKPSVPAKMYNIYKTMKTKAWKRGEGLPDKAVKKPAEHGKPKEPVKPDFGSKKVSGYLVSDAFKKPDKSREKFFKKSSLSSRAAPTPSQRLIAHLDEQTASHKKCFELESEQTLPTILSAHEIDASIAGESMLPRIPSPEADKPVVVLVDDYQMPDVPCEEPVPMEEEKISTGSPEKREGEEGEEKEVEEGEIEEDIVPMDKGESEEEVIKEEDDIEIAVVGVGKAPKKIYETPVASVEQEEEEEEAGEEAEEIGDVTGLSVDVKRIPVKKDEVAAAPVETKEEKEAKKVEKTKEEEEGKRMKIAEKPKAEMKIPERPKAEKPFTSAPHKAVQSLSAPEVMESRTPHSPEEPPVRKAKVESVPIVKETEGSSLETQKAAEPVAGDEEGESLKLKESLVPDRPSIYLEIADQTGELLSESEMNLCKLIKAQDNRDEINLTIQKNRQLIHDFMTKEKKKEAAYSDSKWAKESEQIVSATEEVLMAKERNKMWSQHKENPMFETMEPSIPALANIRLATLSDKPLEKHDANFPKEIKRYEMRVRKVPMSSLISPSLKEKYLPVSEGENYSEKEWQHLIAEKQEQLLKRQMMKRDLDRKKEKETISKEGQMKKVSSEEEESEESESEEEEEIEELTEAEFKRKDKVSKVDETTIPDDSRLIDAEKLLVDIEAEFAEQSESSIKALVPAMISPSTFDYQQFGKAQQELNQKRSMERLKYMEDVQLVPMSDELYKMTWEKSFGGIKEPKGKIKLPRVKYLVKASPKRSFMSVRRESFTLYGKELYPLDDETILNPQKETQLLREREKIFSKKLVPEITKKHKSIVKETIQEKQSSEVVGDTRYTKCLPMVKVVGKIIDSKSAAKREMKQLKIPPALEYYNLFLSDKFNAYQRQSEYVAQKSDIKLFRKYSRPEWYPEDKKLMYSPSYYQQLEKTPEDHRRSCSTIY